MWGFGRFFTILLAASSTNKYAPKSVQEIIGDFRELYSILGEKAPVYVQATPTIRFNFVTPPPKDKHWRDEDVLYSDAELMTDDSTVLFINVAAQHGDGKPIVVYLPGLDGFGISSALQFDDLSQTFELWRMSVKTEDKTSFGDLITTVCQFINQVSASTDRPVYVVAESFGGLLAPAVAMRLENKSKRQKTENPLKGMTLVNPATSFDESNWDIVAPILSTLGFLTEETPTPFGLPSPYAIVGGLTLSNLIPSSDQFENILGTILNLTSLGQARGIIDSIQATMESFRIVGEVLPPNLLEHRIKNWMIVGSSLVNPRLSKLEVPTLVVVGTDDKLIPSRNEVQRLTKTLPNCEILEVKGAGHFVLDDNVNLTEAIIYSRLLDPLNFNETCKPYDQILDWKLPPKDVIDQVRKENVNSLEEAFSPIYISTNAEGERSFGLNNLPKDAPLLFVSNHQLRLDLNLLISKFIEIELPVRGLAHPVIFQQPNRQRPDLNGRIAGLQNRPRGAAGTSNFELFGAVMVTPKNYYRLLQSGQNVLLFPGGVKEVFHGRDQAYELLWPEKVDFVRTAARFNATIIPLSAMGMADSLNILLEPAEIANLPILGERARKFAKDVTAARFDMANEEEIFLPPLVVPGLPSRNYFIFGQPISTSNLDPKDKVACEALYKSVQAEMKRGFRDVLAAREKDPYREAPMRLVYERLNRKKAPTFALSDLDSVSTGHGTL